MCGVTGRHLFGERAPCISEDVSPFGGTGRRLFPKAGRHLFGEYAASDLGKWVATRSGRRVAIPTSSSKVLRVFLILLVLFL